MTESEPENNDGCGVNARLFFAGLLSAVLCKIIFIYTNVIPADSWQ